VSCAFAVPGTAVLGNSEHGQVRGFTVMVTPAAGVSRLALSSTARLRIVVDPGAPAVQL
jgi:hypothetical protein